VRELDEALNAKRDILRRYIKKIKTHYRKDFFSIINPTLISNPHTTRFPERFLLRKRSGKNRFLVFLVASARFYVRHGARLALYLMNFLVYRVVSGKRSFVGKRYDIGIDVFILSRNVLESGEFRENYFSGLYGVLDRLGKSYIFMPRIYGT